MKNTTCLADYYLDNFKKFLHSKLGTKWSCLENEIVMRRPNAKIVQTLNNVTFANEHEIVITAPTNK